MPDNERSVKLHPMTTDEQLRSALAELRAAADIYQATVRPTVSHDSAEARAAYERGRALQERLLAALGHAHDVLNAR